MRESSEMMALFFACISQNVQNVKENDGKIALYLYRMTDKLMHIYINEIICYSCYIK